MKKKLALAMVGFASVMMLTACSGSEDLVTMKGGKITVEEFFEKIKGSDEAKQALSNEIIAKAVNIKYGKEVDKKEVQESYDEQAAMYGDTFKEQLKGAGYTEATFKEKLKTDLEFKAMLSDGVKVTDKQLKETWETYHPEVEVEIAVTSDEKLANEVAEKAAKGKLDEIAKELTKDDKQVTHQADVKFDSTNQQIPAEVKEAAFKLKDGEASKAITVSSMNQYTGEADTTYYIVKMVKKTEKGDDMSKFQKEVEKITLETIIYDQEFMHKRVSQLLKDANVKINDDELKSVLANYIIEETKESSDDKKTEDTKDSKSSDKEKTEDTKDSKSADKEKTEETDESK